VAQIREIPADFGASGAEFRAGLIAAAQPVVLRGLVRDWPVVGQAKAGAAALVEFLKSFDRGRAAGCMAGTPAIGGRFFYSSDMKGMNFGRRDASVSDVLDQLMLQAGEPAPLAIAMQSAPIPDVLPGFAERHPMPLVDSGVVPRIWIGNAISVATHYDSNDNVACVVAGRRRFTLFPPDQVRNLYLGPLELTPAGTPVSMVDVESPDLDRYPRFAEALEHAQTAELAPGDAVFIPYLWWHAVRSLDPVSILVNYWWNDAPQPTGPVQAMLHALLAFRELPPGHRAAWRSLIGHLVFAENGDPGEHLPEYARGVLGEISPDMRRELHAAIAAALRPR
jgi:hypothetical protein